MSLSYHINTVDSIIVYRQRVIACFRIYIWTGARLESFCKSVCDTLNYVIHELRPT